MNKHLEPVNGSTTSPFDAIKRTTTNGQEYWSARDLMPLMAYSTWQKFETPLKRAMATAANQGMDVENLFNRSVKKSGGRPREDFRLARYAAYLVAMNGDPNITEVAAAQHYFAVQTRVAETRPALSGKELMARALIEAQETMQQLEATTQRQAAELAEVAPKVAYHDRFISENSDVLTIDDWAAQYGVKKGVGLAILREKKVIYRKAVTREMSKKKGQQVDRMEHRAYAPYRHMFDLRPQLQAPRYNNGQMRQTLYVRVAFSTQLAEIAGVNDPLEGLF